MKHLDSDVETWNIVKLNTNTCCLINMFLRDIDSLRRLPCVTAAVVFHCNRCIAVVDVMSDSAWQDGSLTWTCVKQVDFAERR